LHRRSYEIEPKEDEMSEANKQKTMMLEIVTPYRHFYEGRVESVSLSSAGGRVGILPGHAPMVIALTPGLIQITAQGFTRYAVLTDGFAEIGQHLLLILCDSANWPEEIDVRRAVEAYHRASARVALAQRDSEDRKYSLNSMKRASERIEAVRRYGDDRQKNLLVRITDVSKPEDSAE